MQARVTAVTLKDYDLLQYVCVRGVITKHKKLNSLQADSLCVNKEEEELGEEEPAY